MKGATRVFFSGRLIAYLDGLDRDSLGEVHIGPPGGGTPQ